jgi:isocitrate dehydrogenase
VAEEKGKFEIVYTKENGEKKTVHVFDFPETGGIGLAMYNTKEVIMIINFFFNF